MFSIANSLIQFGSEHLSNFWFRYKSSKNKITVSRFELVRVLIVTPEGI